MCFQALKVAGQVAGSTISTSPLPYNTLAGHCEALGSGTRQKLSNWLIHENHYTRATNNFSPASPADSYSALEKVSIFTYISSGKFPVVQITGSHQKQTYGLNMYLLTADNQQRWAWSRICDATECMHSNEATSCKPFWQLPQSSWMLKEEKPLRIFSVYLML